MPQIFPRSFNAYAKVSILIAVLFVSGVIGLMMKLVRSSYQTRQGLVLPQPVPFSHDHHTATLGIHCVYCHTSVEESAVAGVPPTETCMNCHSQIWVDSPMLEPVRASWRNQEPIRWNKVYDLPDYVYFNHSIHIKKGVGCKTCHGPVNEMPLLYRATSLQMSWCVDCHRNPEKYVRPREEVFNLDYEPENQAEMGPKLVAEYEINSKDTCSTCHR